MVDARDITKDNNLRIADESKKRMDLVHSTDTKVVTGVPLKDKVEPYVEAIITLRDEFQRKINTLLITLGGLTGEVELISGSLSYDIVCKQVATDIYDQLCGHGTTYVKKWIKENYGI